MRVLAVDARPTERPPEVARLLPPDWLTEMLPQCEFVVIRTPETLETCGLFGQLVLSAMRRGAFLVNIGRGKVVELDAVVAALRSGQMHRVSALGEATAVEPFVVARKAVAGQGQTSG
jgi:phosphoglycerate dehydrogenase-like enzyme